MNDFYCFGFGPLYWIISTPHNIARYTAQLYDPLIDCDRHQQTFSSQPHSRALIIVDKRVLQKHFTFVSASASASAGSAIHRMEILHATFASHPLTITTAKHSIRYDVAFVCHSCVAHICSAYGYMTAVFTGFSCKKTQQHSRKQKRGPAPPNIAVQVFFLLGQCRCVLSAHVRLKNDGNLSRGTCVFFAFLLLYLLSHGAEQLGWLTRVHRIHMSISNIRMPAYIEMCT